MTCQTNWTAPLCHKRPDRSLTWINRCQSAPGAHGPRRPGRIPGQHRTLEETMRKTIIFSTLVALFGFATLAQASERTRTDMRDGIQVTRTASDDSRGDRHERDGRHYRSHKRHD